MSAENKIWQDRSRTLLRKKKTIIGYIGASVGVAELFKFRNAKKEECWRGKILDRKFSVSPKRDCEGWRKVKITIELIDEGSQ
jgi:hypothetical protein